MNNRYRILIFIISIVILWKTIDIFYSKNQQPELESDDIVRNGETRLADKIKVSVYYEALCSDSRNFILKQLAPAYQILRDFLQLDFVPYGKAETHVNGNEITFRCQHGSTECIANKIHACVLVQIKEEATQLKYIGCMINDNMIPHDAGQRCGNELGINYDPIMECANGIEGSKLLKVYGEKTQTVKIPITFIPTIQIDDSASIAQSKLLKNLQKELCGLIKSPPKECTQ